MDVERNIIEHGPITESPDELFTSMMVASAGMLEMTNDE